MFVFTFSASKNGDRADKGEPMLRVLCLAAKGETPCDKVFMCDIESSTEKMVLLRQQNKGQQSNFLLLQLKILLQQPNVLLIELNILLL